MGRYTIEEIGQIVKQNPNKALIDQGKKMADELMLHVHAVGMDQAITRCDFFEPIDLYPERKKYTTSNVDLFGRLLREEDMIFTANGGSSYFSLDQQDEDAMNALLSNVFNEMSLREWMKNFGIEAYRCDPMGIIFVEVENLQTDPEGTPLNVPGPYPTYKSIYSIYDYQPKGRKLEYVCFQLTVAEALSFGINDPEALKDRNPSDLTEYFRFVDDASDIIVKRVKDTVIIATNSSQKNPLPNPWGRTPAFIISNIPMFNNPNVMVSPLDKVKELAKSFLEGRSIRDLQQKYHGFAKAVEPTLECGTCVGTGLLNGQACPDCTPQGAGQGTGFKLRTKISDVAKFPLEALKDGFDFKKIFGYVTPDIEGWKMQDMSLASLEELMQMTYWGTSRMIKQQTQKNQNGEPATATEISVNMAPVYAHLNTIADWAENTEAKIADFIGEFWFGEAFKKSQIAYGRNYVLETPDQLEEKYIKMKAGGIPSYILSDVQKKLNFSIYQNNPAQLTYMEKLRMLDPAPHITDAQAIAIIPHPIIRKKKECLERWVNQSVTFDQVVSLKVEVLDKMLTEFAQKEYDDEVKLKAAEAQQQQEQAATQAFQNVRTGDRIQNTSN